MNTKLPAKLPDFRNQAVILRALILVHLAVCIAVLLQLDDWQAWDHELATAALWVEPILLPTLAILSLLQRQLERLPYYVGVILIQALVLLLVITVYHYLRSALGINEPKLLLREEILAMVMTLSLLGYYQLWMRGLSPRFTEARLAALQARIRPHFFFNSLNAVLSLIRNEPKKAELLLINLSELFRVAMGKQSQLSTLAREVELTRGYLDIEKVRLGERLHVLWHTEHLPEKAVIPSLILQPLLENAVYHGIEPRLDPGVIEISLFRAKNNVHIDIRNPVVADGPIHKGNGIALENVRERLMLYFDAEARLTIKSTSDYYQVHIVLPYQELPDEPSAAHLSRR